MSAEFERLVQVGMVTAVDAGSHKVRVKFKDTDLTSDWLCVLKQPPSVSAYSATTSAGTHSHGIGVSPWMPAINETVLVIYLPVFNSDGFVIGGI